MSTGNRITPAVQLRIGACGAFLLAAVVILPLAGCGAGKQARQEAETHYTLGVSYLRENNSTNALKEFLIAVEADPRNAEYHAALGQAYYLKDAYEKAEEHFLRAVRLDPDTGRYQNNLGALYLAMERWDDAIAAFHKAVGNLLFDSPEVALAGIGFAYYQQREYLQAVSYYKRAVTQNQNYAEGHLRLGEAYFALDKNDLAVEALERARSLNPTLPKVHYRLGLAYTKSRQLNKAIESFETVLRLASGTDLALEAQGHLEILR